MVNNTKLFLKNSHAEIQRLFIFYASQRTWVRDDKPRLARIIFKAACDPNIICTKNPKTVWTRFSVGFPNTPNNHVEIIEQGIYILHNVFFSRRVQNKVLRFVLQWRFCLYLFFINFDFLNNVLVAKPVPERRSEDRSSSCVPFEHVFNGDSLKGSRSF